MSGRDALLTKIRAMNGDGRTIIEAEKAWHSICRGYEQHSDLDAEAREKLFVERLFDYDAEVLQCSKATLLESLLTRLLARGITSLVIPTGLSCVRPEDLIRAGINIECGSGVSVRKLDELNAVLTESTLGIAETGTIVLQDVPGQGPRSLSLVPDHHFCVVRASTILATVPEAMEHLQNTANLPTTFISGPSATADIEMTRIKGVHGPRFLNVLLVS